MKIAFFGTSEFAVSALRSLAALSTQAGNGYSLVAVVTMPDQPVGRKKVITAPPVKVAALELGLPIYQPDSLKKDESFFEVFKNLIPDLAVVASYGNIIPQRYLDIPKHGFLNIHPSLLPKYRGPSPIQTAILNGDKETGVTIMQLDAGMDTGGILAQLKTQISTTETYTELHQRLAVEGARLLVETIPKYISGKLKPVPQDNDQASVTKKFEREDGRIDWSQTPQMIYNQIRALNPEPGTWTTWQDQIINIKQATIAPNGSLEIQTLQLAGKRDTSLHEFLHGHPDFKISDLK